MTEVAMETSKTNGSKARLRPCTAENVLNIVCAQKHGFYHECIGRFVDVSQQTDGSSTNSNCL